MIEKLAFILIALFLIGCSKYNYEPPEDKSCDFSTKSLCESKGCIWHPLTDVANEKPMPATCCPKDMFEDLGKIQYDPEDPCTIIPG